jgi:hypothetical protein
MQKRLNLWIVLLIWGTTLTAQTSETNKKSRTDIGYVTEVLMYNFDDINRVLNANDYPALSNGALHFELSNRKRVRNTRWLSENAFGFSFTGTDNQPVANQQTRFQEFTYNARYAYDVRRDKRFQILPYVGLGLRYQRLRLYEGVDNSGSFGSLANSDYRVRTLSQFPVSGDLGLSVEQKISFKSMDLSIGVRGGAQLMLASDWALDGTFAMDLPLPNSVVPYFGIVIRTMEKM